MREWFLDHDPLQRAAIVVTALLVVAAVVFLVLPFHTEDGIPCRAPIVAWREVGAGGGVPGELDQPVRGPCVDEARARVLGGTVAIALTLIGGKVGVDLLGLRDDVDL